ncbi:thrombopoietin receptor [Lepisosteus oculatus]|uniref:thrombopoietin receptor n=1 Tax=Lepisosteus oculatus TaxID=7918 RepID=UPI0037124061
MAPGFELKICFWISVSVWICWRTSLVSTFEPVSPLIKKASLLLADDQDPKCFTRTESDFTCFWEGNDSTYELYYKTEIEEKKCALTQQRDRNTLLHVCSFPAHDVFLFTVMHITVVDCSTNNTIYTRNVSVENQVLPDPPANVSLVQNGKPLQLRVSWNAPAAQYRKMLYEIKYAPANLQQQTRRVNVSKSRAYNLVGLIPGEIYSAQVRAKRHDDYNSGVFWSEWSWPVSAVVPQHPDDINLQCHSHDLRNIRCQWRDKEATRDTQFTLYYKQSKCKGAHVQKKCVQNETTSDDPIAHCTFPGEESCDITVTLQASSTHHNRTFFTEPFRMNGIVRTDPPRALTGGIRTGWVWLHWEPPLLQLADQLQYEVHSSLSADLQRKLMALETSNTSALLDLPAGNTYDIRVRARPNGHNYSGSWSDWSEPLTVAVPSRLGYLLMAFIPLVLLLIAAVLIATCSKCLRKIKLLLWPPVPNLDKVLESFLMEINKQLPPQSFNDKLCDDEITSSPVEIVSEKELQDCIKLRGDQPSPPFIALGHGLGSPSEGKPQADYIDHLDTTEDYVVLDTENFIRCLQGNEYVYEEEKLLGTCFTRSNPTLQCEPCLCTFPGPPQSSIEILNHSYLLLAKSQSDIQAELELLETANQYTNLNPAGEVLSQAS